MGQELQSFNKICYACGEDVLVEDFYCWNCGAPLLTNKSQCWQCKAVTDTKFVFCPMCGHALVGIRQMNCKLCGKPFIAKLPNDELCAKCKSK
jgi:hypothetical protein